MTAIVGLVVRGLSLAGVSLSPFWAGAIVMAALSACAGGAGWHLYNAGWRAADATWQAKALQSQIDALKADRDVAARALADARDRTAAVEKDSNEEKEGTAKYVDELKAKFQAACAIDDNDLRGLLAQPAAGNGRPRARAAAGARWFAKPDAGAGHRQGR